MFDPPKPDGEINSKRDRQPISAAASDDGNARSPADSTQVPVGPDPTNLDVEVHEVRLIEAAEQGAARQEPEKPEPQRTRTVLHLRRKDGAGMQLKKP